MDKHVLPKRPTEAVDYRQAPDWLRQTETILESLNEGIVIVDDQLRIVFANEALTQLGGYESGELMGRTPDVIFPSEDLPYLMR